MASSEIRISAYNFRNEIRKAIDRYEWKHSWHLPTDKYGQIDWFSMDTKRQCLDVLDQYRKEARTFAEHCDYLAQVIRDDIKRQMNEG